MSGSLGRWMLKKGINQSICEGEIDLQPISVE